MKKLTDIFFLFSLILLLILIKYKLSKPYNLI